MRNWLKFINIMIFLNITCTSMADTMPVLPSPDQIDSQFIAAKTWTLPELTDLALSLNPMTRLAWAQVKAATANLGIAKSYYWLQIDYTLKASYTDPQKNNENNTTTTFFGCSYQDQYCSNFNLSYTLWDFGARYQQVKSSHYQLIASELTQNQDFQQIVLQVEQAYYQLLGDQALVQADITSLNETMTNLNSANALHKQGMATIGDVYQAESMLASAQLTLQQARGALSIAQGELAVAIGLPVQTHLHIVSLPTAINTQNTMHVVTHYLDAAKQQRPELLAAEAQVKADKATLKATQREMLPTIDLSASTQQAYPRNAFNGGRQSNLAITLTVPIFSGFEQVNQVRLANANVQEAKAQRDQIAQQVQMQVWQAYYNLQTAQASIHSSQAYLVSSTQAAQQTAGQYRNGVGNILSVLTTQTTEADARVQDIQSKLNWYVALAQLMAAVGSLPTSSSNQTDTGI